MAGRWLASDRFGTILRANHHSGGRIGGPLDGRTRQASRILATGDVVVTQKDMLRQQRLPHAIRATATPGVTARRSALVRLRELTPAPPAWARTPRFNDRARHGHRAGLPDCVLTADSDELSDSYDLSRHRRGSWPRAPHSSQTDEVLWVYLTRHSGARCHAHRLFGRRQAIISDHPPVVVRVEIRSGG